MLDDERLLGHLVDEARLLADTFAHCAPAAPVPGLNWDAQTVVMHTGAVHRWAADIVGRGLQTNETGGSAAFWPSVEDASRLAAWWDEGVGALVSTLHAAPASLTCFTFDPQVPARTFWIRRQAHETAIHRADVEAAAGGQVTAFSASFAQDGLGEIVGGFATEPAFATDHPGRLLLHAADGPAWLVTFGGERNVSASGELTASGELIVSGEPTVSGELIRTAADAVVRGTSDQLYRWAWSRPASVEVSGDAEVLALWQAVQVQ